MGFFGKLFGSGGDRRPPDAASSKKAWIIGTAAWGGVMLECGAAEMLLIVLPIVDDAPVRAIPAMPPSLIKAMIVCNGGTGGHLATAAIARAAGQKRVYAIDASAPVERGGGAAAKLEVVPLPAELRLGP